MLQCLPLADSCLAMGAASTRRAVDTIHELAADGAREAWDWRCYCNTFGADPSMFVTYTDRHIEINSRINPTVIRSCQ